MSDPRSGFVPHGPQRGDRGDRGFWSYLWWYIRNGLLGKADHRL